MKTKNKIRGFVLHSAAAAMPPFSLALVTLSFSGKPATSLRQGKALAFAQGVFMGSVLSSANLDSRSIN
jgi:hypothetical protein